MRMSRWAAVFLFAVGCGTSEKENPEGTSDALLLDSALFDGGSLALNLWGISVGADAVFVTSAETAFGRVVRVPLDGSQAEVIASDLDLPSSILAVGDDVYTLTLAGLVKVPADGSGPAELVAPGGSGAYGGLTADNTHLYWTTYNEPGTVFRLPIDGSGPAETLYTGDVALSGVAVGAGRVYWTVVTEGLVQSVATDGTNPTTVATDLYSPRTAIATDDDHVYWMTEDFPPVLWKAPLSGGAPVSLGPTQTDEVGYTSALAIVGGYAYHRTATAECSGLARTPVAGGVPEPIALDAALGCPIFHALSGPNIYFTSWAGVSRVALP
jgi:hypothetical protein